MRVLATYNIKGGVGKTSTAVNLAYLSARQGNRTLLWDLDPQGAATFLFRIGPHVRGGVKALVKGRTPLDALIKGTDFNNLDVLPADLSYRRMDHALDQSKHPNRRIAQLVEPLGSGYDVLILDCPPGMSLVSEGVMRAADTLLVPLVPATLSMRTFEQLTDFVGKAKQPRPRILAFFSMVDARKRLHRETVAQVVGQRSEIAQAIVPAASIVEQMGPRRLPVMVLSPTSPAAAAYEQLWWEAVALGER
ncbi:MAG: ParA family protein [Candidatus Dormiibacterota bacterium]